MGHGPEVRGEDPVDQSGAARGGRWLAMFALAPDAAELAAGLARAVGPEGVVCLGCPLTVDGRHAGERALITVSRPPLDRLPIEPGRLLLVVSLEGPPLELEACAAAKVPEVWSYLNKEGLLSVLSDPIDGRYRRRSLILPGESRRLAALPAVEFTPLPTG